MIGKGGCVSGELLDLIRSENVSVGTVLVSSTSLLRQQRVDLYNIFKKNQKKKMSDT